MSTTASLPRRTVSRRTQILASASALVAAASVAVTLAVAGGGDGQTTVSQPSSSPPRRSRAWRPSTGTTRPPVTARSRMACRTPPIASTTSAKSLQRGSERAGPRGPALSASRIGSRGAAGRPRGRVAGGPRRARRTRAGRHRSRGRGRHRQDRALAGRDRHGQASAGCACSSPGPRRRRPACPTPRSAICWGRSSDELAADFPAPQRRALDVALLQDGRHAGAARSAGGRRRHARRAASRRRGRARARGRRRHPVARSWPRRRPCASRSAGSELTHEVLLLATRRTGERGADALDVGIAEERLTRIAVGPLGPRALKRMVHSRLGESVQPSALARMTEIAGGNPYFALELGRAALRRGGGAEVPLPGGDLRRPRRSAPRTSP